MQCTGRGTLRRPLAEHADHEQHRVRAVPASDVELHLVDDEVLAQHRDVDRVGDIGEVVERAANAVGSVSTLIAAAPPSW